MRTLDLIYSINSNSLNSKYYFQSLIDQSYNLGLLSENELLKIKSDLILILSKQVDRWSQGESSSIPTEKAQDIVASIMFVIGVFLKTYKLPEQAIETLKTKSLEKCFNNGLRIIQRKIVMTKRLQKNIVENLLNTSNIFYHSTIIDGINGFFKLYLPQFSANEIHITADYPTFIDRPELDGIEFIEQYLNYIEAENDFCIQFESQNIHHLLCGLTRDYTIIPLNIFEPVCLSAIGLIMLDRNPKQLNLSKNDIFRLYYLFFNKSKIEIEKCIKKAVLLLYKKIDLQQKSKKYISMSIPKFTLIIQNAIITNTLDKVFLVPSYPEQQQKITFSYGERMDDLKYNKLVEKILQTTNSNKKINMILQEVHSLADLLDVLSDTELCYEEFQLLINELPIPIFTILLAQYPCDDLLERKSEKFLFAALQKRLHNLSIKDNYQVKKILQALKKDNIID